MGRALLPHLCLQTHKPNNAKVIAEYARLNGGQVRSLKKGTEAKTLVVVALWTVSSASR